MTGFIALDRSALDHPLLKDAERFRAWFWIVARACWKPTPFDLNGKIVSLERGQLCASRAQLAEAWNWSPSAVERFLVRLETEQMIGRATGQGRTIITVCNYGKYQDVEEKTGQVSEQQTGQRSDSDRTAKEQGNQETKDIPSPNGDGRGAPGDSALDLAKTIFRSGVIILKAGGQDERQARSTIGRWKKTYSDGVVLAVLARCQIAQPEAPVEWIAKALQAEQLRAAGMAPQPQQQPEERASVREIGMDLAARKRRERLAQEQERIAIGAR